MGRKRSRKVESEDEESDDSDVGTIVVNRSQRYGLRPRKAQYFSEDAIDEEAELSDFEDEFRISSKNVSTIIYKGDELEENADAEGESESIDYDDLIQPGVVVNENLIDYEKVIERTEIQVHKRNTPPSPTPKKRRGRKPKWLIEKEQAEEDDGGFRHFLDTKDCKVEEILNPDFAKDLDNIETADNVDEINSQQENIENLSEDIENVPTDNIENQQNSDFTDVNVENEPNSDFVNTTTAEEEEVDDPDAADPEFNENSQTPTSATENEVPECNSPAATHLTTHSEDSVQSVKSTQSIVEILDDSEMTVEQTRNQYWGSLIQSMDDKKYFVECSSDVAVLREKMPKAKFHYLIIPRQNIRGLIDLTDKHLRMIEQIYETSKKVVAYPEHKDCVFKIGFNAHPTMFIYNQKFLWLHLHVVSDDMESDDLMLKKHWNAIHSKIFVHPEDVIKQLQDEGKITLPTLDECKDILNGDIRCHKCDFVTPKFSAIKKHLAAKHKS